MRITIVGAGFSGSALASELARQAGPGVELCLIGMADSYSRGVAYGEARPEHLLNVRASELGATPDQPGAFADWLNLSDRARVSYLPRLAYGEYLHAQLQTAVAGSTAAFNQIRQEAIAVERASAGFRVHLADGSDFLSDKVVLAVGALPPQALSGVGPRLAIHPSYLNWPWQDGAIDAIAPDARLLIVGTGLTMADVVTTLQRRGHRGPIVALSRHGLLPRAHGEYPPTQIALRTLAPVVDDWRSLIDALRPHLQTFWRGVPLPQRASFLRHLRSYWEAVRHRIAPQLAGELQALRDSGQLQVRAGRLLRARRGDDAVEVLIRERGGTALHSERYEVLIRATGLDTDVERTTHPLVAHLRESGLVAADPLGLGLKVSDRFEVLDAKGGAVRGLYAIGPLLRAQLWEITAVPELRTAARTLTGQLLAATAAARTAGAQRLAVAG
jgi:uncharacterized NAD(P)/FAD-binding protein YdhS